MSVIRLKGQVGPVGSPSSRLARNNKMSVTDAVGENLRTTYWGVSLAIRFQAADFQANDIPRLGQTCVRGHWTDALKLPVFSVVYAGRIPGVCLCISGVGGRI
jgi:hypothetical protein